MYWVCVDLLPSIIASKSAIENPGARAIEAQHDTKGGKVLQKYTQVCLKYKLVSIKTNISKNPT